MPSLPGYLYRLSVQAVSPIRSISLRSARSSADRSRFELAGDPRRVSALLSGVGEIGRLADRSGLSTLQSPPEKYDAFLDFVGLVVKPACRAFLHRVPGRFDLVPAYDTGPHKLLGVVQVLFEAARGLGNDETRDVKIVNRDLAE